MLEKCVIGSDYIQQSTLLVLIRMILGACFDLGRSVIDTAIKATIRSFFLCLTFLKEEGRGLEETSLGCFSGQNR